MNYDWNKLEKKWMIQEFIIKCFWILLIFDLIVIALIRLGVNYNEKILNLISLMPNNLLISIFMAPSILMIARIIIDYQFGVVNLGMESGFFEVGYNRKNPLIFYLTFYSWLILHIFFLIFLIYGISRHGVDLII